MIKLLPLILLCLAIFLVVAVFALVARYLRLWVQSYASSAGIGLFDLIESSDPTALTGLPLIWVSAALRRAGIPVP